jgi:hypothetical protein
LVADGAAESLPGPRRALGGQRIVGGVPDESVNELNVTLEELQLGIDDEDFAAISEAAQAIRELAGDIGS